jgi:hypothetical protein
MPRQKNNFLNAKPVSKMGGGSGGVRKPNKPYSKPPAKPKAEKPARWDAKTKTERLQEAAKTKPKSSAPKQVIKKPVTRTGPVKGPVPPKGRTVTMPNSQRAGYNLPKAGARAERTAQRVMDLKKEAAAKASTPKPNASAGTNAAVRGAASTAAKGAGIAGRVGGALTTALMIPAAIKNIADVAERNRQWDAYKERMGMNKPQVKPKQGNAQSRFAGARDRNLQRINSDPRFAAPKEKPKPPAPAPRQQPPTASAPAARPSASRPSQTTPSRTTTTGSRPQQARPAEKKPSMARESFDRSGKGSLGPNYGVDQFGDKNGIDMERRRAFLDSKDSQSGRKAVNKLMEERRKKQRENDSTSK